MSGHVGNVFASDTLLLEISGFLHHRDVGQILTLSLEQHWSEFKLELQRKKKNQEDQRKKDLELQGNTIRRWDANLCCCPHCCCELGLL